MKYLLKLIFLTLICNVSFAQPNTDILFQSSIINSLLNGVYDGDMTMLKLKGRGDFGLGTFNTLDGEMIMLDGIIYKIKADGKAYPVPNSEKTPFAAVTFFEADTSTILKEEMDLAALQGFIDKMIPTPNIFYAIKIEGFFKYIKTRSVPPQKKPYIPLVEIVKEQPVFELKMVKGTIVGFRVPEFAAGMNVPGYHFHFLNDERSAGGHILDCRITNVKISIDYTHNFNLSLPSSSDFYKTELSKDKKDELEKVEK